MIFLYSTGAAAAGIDSILVTSHGVHRDELNSEEDSKPGQINADLGLSSPNESVPKSLLMKVTDLCDREGVNRPYFILKSFK